MNKKSHVFEPDERWQGNGKYWQLSSPTPLQKLPLGIYTVTRNISGFYLIKESDNFEFPYKVYNYEQEFINRVISTYNLTNKNFGVLLNGFKGTGKSVTAKIICNEIKLPIILVTEYIDGIENFIASIPNDVVIFIDEYEKIFKKELQQYMLALMDGASDLHGRKFFLLTTNTLNLNENMISRPGRIRYIKTYKDLDVNIINAVVDDYLLHKHHKDDVMKFIKRLEIITIDLIKSIVQEVNLYNETPETFKHIFNAVLRKQAYKVSLLFYEQNSINIAEAGVLEWNLNNHPLIDRDLGDSVYLQKYIGDVVHFIDENTSIIRIPSNNIYITKKINTVTTFYKDFNADAKNWKLIPEKFLSIHSSYYNRTLGDLIQEGYQLIVISVEEVDGYHSTFLPDNVNIFTERDDLEISQPTLELVGSKEKESTVNYEGESGGF